MTLLFALLLVVVLLVSWALTVIGMPGNWLMLVATAAYAWLLPGESRAAIGWEVVVVLLVLAAVGEIVELLAGAAGTSRAGGSRRSAVLALLGSIAGGVVGLVLGMPIPLLGSVVGALLLAGVGAMGGAMLGEMWSGGNLQLNWHIGIAAFTGRLLGTLGKALIGALMVVIAVGALVL